MKKQPKIWPVFVLLAAALVAVAGWYLTRHAVPVVQPRGEIGNKERNLIIFCAVISAVIVIPVFGLLGYIGYKYRETNRRAKYTPELGGSKLAETVWWLVPTFIIVIISVVTWQSSYALDPFKSISSDPEVIQVVATTDNWLFIYPKENFALQGFAWIPVGRSVEFELTSDTVMTSFWAPQLGGQMYAMPGMVTKLNLQADKAGSYAGRAANIDGVHFADHTFSLYAVSDFSQMAARAHGGGSKLTMAIYKQQVLPAQTVKTDQPFGSVDPGLYDTIVMNYMMPMGETNTAMHRMKM